jgi:hypothetical protein
VQGGGMVVCRVASADSFNCYEKVIKSLNIKSNLILTVGKKKDSSCSLMSKASVCLLCTASE